MAELIFSALRLLGAMWMVATFIVVAGCFVRLVGEGKDLVGVLFGSIEPPRVSWRVFYL
ncbi:hypothetical protein O5835_18185 [Escherichia coli]|nr:hypothetical protein [Escherichia coli]MCZ5192012.1 hypothetical protein [Escherichia coli]